MRGRNDHTPLGRALQFTPPLHLFPGSLSHTFPFLCVEVWYLHPKMQVWSFTRLFLSQNHVCCSQNTLLFKFLSPKKPSHFSITLHRNSQFVKAVQLHWLFSIELYECIFRNISLSLWKKEVQIQECGVFFLQLVAFASFENILASDAIISYCAEQIKPNHTGSRKLSGSALGLSAERFCGAEVSHKVFPLGHTEAESGLQC